MPTPIQARSASATGDKGSRAKRPRSQRRDHDMLDYLAERMSVPPLDRIADAFAAHRAIDPGIRVLKRL